MLKALTVQNYALIQQLSIDFEKDFSTLTGETGAGKSILLGALSLVLGARADSSAANKKDEKCIVEATFELEKLNLKSFFEQNNLDYEDETIIRREILSNGKSRAFINDTPVNLNNLKDLANKLIDIHSQHENLELNNNKFQLKVLDSLANNDALLNTYKNVYNKFKQYNEELETLKEKSKLANSDFDFNQFQYNQLAEIHLEQINLQELENELEILNNAEDIQLNLNTGFTILSESENNVLDQLKQTKQAFEKIKNYFNKANNYSNRIDSIIIDLKDIASEIESSAESIEFNPEKAFELKEMLDKIYSLQQKHQLETINELITLREDFNAKLQAKENYSLEISALEKNINGVKEELKKLSSSLTKNRNTAAPKLSERIISQLSELGMPYASFKVDIYTNEAFTSDGQDKINFLFSANKNQAAANISKIASGGEISRLMLSIKSILSESTALPTIIFDEIDTGVSGEIADKMADIMKQMAENMQVISITHLPQIAARGKTQYKVYKKENATTVETKIDKLKENERIEEIARMLSGKDISPEAIENAKTLIFS
ncbi:MAG: DNA repair protein RecN [Salinivirgaceae bacterium]|nr:DNA repair protein RecN [Salinivirgaceae bacterium]